MEGPLFEGHIVGPMTVVQLSEPSVLSLNGRSDRCETLDK